VTTEVALPSGRTPAARTADFIGQATAVEQARAVAEVQAAIVVAQQCPRDVQAARAQMLDSCQQMKLAERAFFKFPRDGQNVSGPSVHLARELARCWGNVQYGIAELRRDDHAGISEMQAFAWDVQTNTRSVSTFVVPHGRDTKKGRKVLTELRDIYENNANQGARRVREAIFAILPSWFTEEAQDRCNLTLREGGGKPLAVRITEAVRGFGALGVAEAQLVEKVGRPRDKWDEYDVARLSVTYTSIQRGETTKEVEFPQAAQRVTAADITGSKPAANGGEPELPDPNDDGADPWAARGGAS
jgi:hypothetical protein